MDIATVFHSTPMPGRSCDWLAWDRDTYDGTPDSSPRQRAIGIGPTEEAAIRDLLEQLEDA